MAHWLVSSDALLHALVAIIKEVVPSLLLGALQVIKGALMSGWGIIGAAKLRKVRKVIKNNKRIVKKH